jgi:hypothetical protein
MTKRACQCVSEIQSAGVTAPARTCAGECEAKLASQLRRHFAIGRLRTRSGSGTMARFVKGQSGNPGGKPKAGYNFLHEIRKYEPRAIEVLCRAMQCEKGGHPDPIAIRAAELVVAYSRGRPAQTQTVRVIRSLEDLSDEELHALIGDTGDQGEEHIH